ncbi:mariner Mos1 transposase [Trichonephila clavipes]|nr:mariner Mos1 transposase [Trichonephila clavipes]
MKRGYPIAPRNQNNSRWNGDTHLHPSRSKPNKLCQSARLWEQCSGIGVVFGWWTLCHKEQRSTQVPTVSLYGTSEEQNKRRDMLLKRVLLLHDNGSPYTSRTSRELIESFVWEVLDHSPYSPDLAPGDFHLFGYLKHSLGGKLFNDYNELKVVVNSWLSDQAVDFFVMRVFKI